MRNTVFFILLLSISLNCSDSNKIDNVEQQQLNSVDSIVSVKYHLLKESFKDSDIIFNDYLKEELIPIRKNFKAINLISDWSNIDTLQLFDTNEGGEAIFYYINDTIYKVTVKRFGETFQQLDEYYLINEKLSFVFEKTSSYNRPIYYDSIVMHENNDSEAFNSELSETEENRNYFINKKLIHRIESGDCGSPFPSDYLEKEEIRILNQFDNLIIKIKASAQQ